MASHLSSLASRNRCRLMPYGLAPAVPPQIIPMDERTGACSEAFNVRLEELCVIDMVWLHPHTGGTASHTGETTSAHAFSRCGPLSLSLCCMRRTPVHRILHSYY